MGKLRGFVEFDRVNEDYISVEKRIKNFKEFTIKPKDDELVNKEEDVWIVEYHFVTVAVHSAI